MPRRSFAHFSDRDPGAFRENGGRHRSAAVFERKGSGSGRRERNGKIVPHRIAMLEFVPANLYAAVVHVDDQPLADEVAPFSELHVHRICGRRRRPVLNRKTVFAAGHHYAVAQPRRLDRGKSALPEDLVVGRTLVAVPAERDGVRVLRRKEGRGSSVVLPPRMRTADSVAVYPVLGEEERLARIDLERRHELRKPRRVVPAFVALLSAGEVRQHEIVSLHALMDDRRPGLAETALPRGFAVVAGHEQHPAHRIFVGIELQAQLAFAVGFRADVVVAVMHKIGDRFAV